MTSMRSLLMLVAIDAKEQDGTSGGGESVLYIQLYIKYVNYETNAIYIKYVQEPTSVTADSS